MSEKRLKLTRVHSPFSYPAYVDLGDHVEIPEKQLRRFFEFPYGSSVFLIMSSEFEPGSYETRTFRTQSGFYGVDFRIAGQWVRPFLRDSGQFLKDNVNANRKYMRLHIPKGKADA